jgi:hypothetical protein
MAKKIVRLRVVDPPRQSDQVGKRLIFDRETWRAVDLLARDQMKDLQELTEEAFRDLLKKHGRTADFREALRMSARNSAARSEAKGTNKSAARNRAGRRKTPQR